MKELETKVELKRFTVSLVCLIGSPKCEILIVNSDNETIFCGSIKDLADEALREDPLVMPKEFKILDITRKDGTCKVIIEEM